MPRRILTVVTACLAAAIAAIIPVASQAQSAGKGKTPTKTTKAPTKEWAPPKTPWGDPDLQGTWTSDDTWGIPMERPAQYGTRAYLTEQELAQRAKQVEQAQARLVNPGDNHSPAKAQADALAQGKQAPQATGAFGRGVDAAPVPGHWGEAARRASKQTSQIVEPANGRIPPLTPEGQKRLAAKTQIRQATQVSAPENWSHYDRCITRGVAGSIIPVIYGNGLEIVQGPGVVSIRYEMVHDHRIIPLTAKSHPGSNVRSYLGDPIGHWEGNTLVVETTNFIEGKLSIGANGDGGAPYSEQLKLVERFTRSAANVIDYEMLIDDPGTYTAPWKIAFPITQEPGYQLFEYACHEGNMSLRNSLSAARAEEAATGKK